MSRCIDCASFRLRDAGVKLAQAGFGCCAHRGKFIVFSAQIERSCSTFEAAPKSQVSERRIWLEGVKKAGYDVKSAGSERWQ